MKRKQWVSKLTYDDAIANNEVEVGKRLKKAPGLFITVTESCKIPVTSLTKMKECSMVKKNHTYRLLYSNYVPSKELADYLKDASFSRIFRSYYQLCDLLSVLITYKVVHHDLHFGNILYTDQSKLVLIDFGLSMIVDDLADPAYLRQVFSSYMPRWVWYPIEIHILSYYVQYGAMRQEHLEHLLDQYTEVLFEHFPSMKRGYRDKALDVFLPWLETPLALCQYWHTWDYYNIALRFMYLNYKDGIKEFDQILYDMVHPNPTKRPSSLEVRSRNQSMIRSFDLSRLSKIDATSKERPL